MAGLLTPDVIMPAKKKRGGREGLPAAKLSMSVTEGLVTAKNHTDRVCKRENAPAGDYSSVFEIHSPRKP